MSTTSLVQCIHAESFENRDVGFETYKAHRRGATGLEASHLSEPGRLGMVAVKRATFQSIASM